MQPLRQREAASWALHTTILQCRYTDGKRFRKWKELNLKRTMWGDGCWKGR